MNIIHDFLFQLQAVGHSLPVLIYQNKKKESGWKETEIMGTILEERNDGRVEETWHKAVD